MSSALQDVVNSVPLIDNHTHQIGIGYSSYGLRGALTEASGSAQNDVVHTLVWKRSLKELGKLLGVPPSEEAILAERTRLGEDKYTELLFSKTGTFQLLIDSGLYGPLQSLEWHDRFTKAPTKCIVRLERLAEDLVLEMAKERAQQTGADLLEAFERRFKAALDPPREGVVGLKTIAAYRTGLGIRTVALEPENRAKVAAALGSYLKDAAAQLDSWKEPPPSDVPPPPFVPLGPRIRIGDKPTIDFLVLTGALIAVKHNLPLQAHVGHGDCDMRLLDANPLLFQPMLQDSRFENLKLVLLHFSWPYCREAGWLASSFKGVYCDLGEMQAFGSRNSLVQGLVEIMHLAPLNKMLYSSDAHVWPETYYLGAKYFREALFEALKQVIAEGDLDEKEAIEAVHMIAYRNSIEAYNLDTVVPEL
ncbi:amidohydrolase-domain-containing protein [Hyaloraphidium curvatum]|nr:amidohydrolase-domain-containing protein [Hyaloraphidium curvatum]